MTLFTEGMIGIDPGKMTAAQRLDKVAALLATAKPPIRPDLPTPGSPSESAGNPKESPWLPRPARPDGGGRPEQEHAVGDAPGPDAELALPVRDERAARRWLVQQIARRAVEILAEGNDGK